LPRQLQVLLGNGKTLHELPVSLNGKRGIVTQGLLSAWCVDRTEGRWLMLAAVCNEAIERQRETAYQEIKRLKEQLELERDYLRDEIEVTSSFGEIIGASEALNRTLAKIEAVASTPANVLILGESGVGKEMVAHGWTSPCPAS
jgi:transcriptional regulator with GAF, ATPase, and Fis domain